jgi:F-type H+-transporting ATPase subunit epsilon
MAMTLHLDIVSAEKAIYNGRVEYVNVSGQEGSLGIYPGHTALLTGIKPGEVTALDQQGKKLVFYVSGGILEVQPDVATILADTVIRADDIDEAAALDAKEKAQAMLAGKKSSDVDYDAALVQLQEAAAQLRVIKDLNKLRNRNKIS